MFSAVIVMEKKAWKNRVGTSWQPESGGEKKNRGSNQGKIYTPKHSPKDLLPRGRPTSYFSSLSSNAFIVLIYQGINLLIKQSLSDLILSGNVLLDTQR